MNWAERVLIALAGLLLAAVAAGAVYTANSQGQTFTEGQVPLSIYLGQIIFEMAPTTVLVGLGILVGLLFSRGLRWLPRADSDEADVDAGSPE
ncbi:hypothetical protein [Lacisediminihabitans sp.]|uniref:hypothetical protein n=1 Tax=Lacisediminihabitans sp. TaxID=2787631 RepID=UPI00374D1CA5